MHTRRYVVMGVSGSGKTTVGPRLARALGLPYVEGDDFHPPSNIQKMRAGIPLTDADREPWLRRIAARLRDAKAADEGLVIASSALKRKYRDLLRASGDPDVQFVYLQGTKSAIEERLAHRHDHFMPPGLLESQLAALEEPGADEHAWVSDISKSPDSIVADLIARVHES